MKQGFVWTLVIILVLLLFLVVFLFFSSLFQTISRSQPTPTSIPTFIPTATQPVVVEVTPTTDTPTPTFTPVSQATPTASPTPPATATNTPVPVIPQVVAATTVNVRAGPGTVYPVISSLPPGIALPVIGQNEVGTWWQVRQEDGLPGWVAASVVEASDVANVPIAQAPPAPEPTPTPISETTPAPVYQFEPTGWYGDTNAGLTRFLGNITDANGDPVNGVTIEAQCGTYRIISNPSGPVPAFNSTDSAYDPPGFYDITVDTRPIPCQWLLTVVHTEDGQTTLAKLSDTFEVEVTVDQSIIVANWRKNW